MTRADAVGSSSGVPAHIVRNEVAALYELRLAPRYQRWVIESFGPSLRGRVLEVGPGLGNFTRFLAPRVDHLTAVEPEAEMADAVASLGLPNVTVMRSTVESLPLGGAGYDAAVLVNVLEHIEDDADAMRRVVAALRPRGRVYVLVPAHAALFGSLDKVYGHHRRYTVASVRRLFDASGLEHVESRYFNPIGALGWFFMGRVVRTRTTSATAVALAERVAVPLGRGLERLGHPPFGQSVIAVGRRP